MVEDWEEVSRSIYSKCSSICNSNRKGTQAVYKVVFERAPKDFREEFDHDGNPQKENYVCGVENEDCSILKIFKRLDDLGNCGSYPILL